MRETRLKERQLELEHFREMEKLEQDRKMKERKEKRKDDIISLVISLGILALILFFSRTRR